jgi:alkylation response protein AidB-like acyl-CoA dehydrogenase
VNFELGEEQQLIVDTARQFAESVLRPRAAARDHTSAFPEAELRELGKLGLLGVKVPEAYGGSQAGAVAYALALSEIAAADASVSVAMAVTNMVAEVICAYGSDEQKRTYVPRLCSGQAVAGAFALSEPQAGSDVASMRTQARRDGDGYRLDGNKQWITSGDRAGVLIVWARTDGDAESQAGGRRATAGISAFIVEGGTPGLRPGRPEHKLGLRGSSTVPLTFEECRVPPSALLSREGDGFKIAMTALDGGRIGIAAQAIGVARAALTAAVNYAKERKQFGQPIADFQAIRNMLADGATQLDAARLLCLRAAFLKDLGQPFSQQAAMAKLYASEMSGRVCDMALQVHGGYGYTEEFPVERYLRDARVQRIYEGTSEIQRLVIARSLLKELSDHGSH